MSQRSLWLALKKKKELPFVLEKKKGKRCLLTRQHRKMKASSVTAENRWWLRQTERRRKRSGKKKMLLRLWIKDEGREHIALVKGRATTTRSKQQASFFFRLSCLYEGWSIKSVLTWRASIKEKKKREIERSYLNKKKKTRTYGTKRSCVCLCCVL